MPTCDNCDAFVTADFVRVFGHAGAVAACVNCTSGRELREGKGVPTTALPS